MSQKKIVYWAPVFFDDEKDWNLFYYDLESLYDYHRPDANKESGSNNYFYCPAFKNLARNTFVIKNPIHTHYVFEDGVAKVKSRNHVMIEKQHDPSVKNSLLIMYGMQFVFFSEEDIIAKLTSPFFNDSPYLKNCSLVPGQLNIKKWFRNLNLEFQIWPGKNEMVFEKDEVIAYVNFECGEDEIVLKRFQMNKRLHELMATCSSAVSWESFVPLYERYQRFMKTRTNVLVLNEIKKNLVE
jgi:hypothetical protein